ncbi:hypothetical protein OG21DRAFT_1509064 [Imleria badia]|nr:hypothetical protein OG21DRAFT_1509064 [Imleria badia]
MGFGRFPAMVCPWIAGGTLTSYLECHESLTIGERLTLVCELYIPHHVPEPDCMLFM